MSTRGNDEDQLPSAERFASDEILVEERYEAELRLALRHLDVDPGAASLAGEHGLVRVPLEPANSPDEFFADLRKHLHSVNSPALNSYGRNRLYTIEASSTGLPDPQIWGSRPNVIQGVSADVPDPQIWGSGRTTAYDQYEPERSSDDAGLGVVVGVLDTKITNHDYLSGGFIALPSSIQTVQPGSKLEDKTGHATFVAGLILQQAPAATVHVRQVLDETGCCDSVALHDAIIDFAKQPIDILNLSLGCNTADDRPPFALRRAIAKFQAERPQAIVVAAAGNHPAGRRFWPAALPSVLAVTSAAPDQSGWDEGRGYPSAPWVDVAAPGDRVISTFLTGAYLGPDGGSKTYHGWGIGNGTSFACAVAAGYLARNWFPGCRASDVLRFARLAGAPITYTGGRVVLGIDNVLRETRIHGSWRSRVCVIF